jgi:microcystin-dependent protein
VDPFVAEIRIFPFNFAPRGWAFCNGQLLPISQNTALFSLLGTQFGGNGTSNFGLPNLQGSAPIGQGQGPGLSQYFVGEPGGTPAVTLLTSEMPQHTHVPSADAGAGNQSDPTGNTWSTEKVGRQGENIYASTANVQLSPNAISIAGSSFPHNNMPPFLVVTFIIELQGIFPARS